MKVLLTEAIIGNLYRDVIYILSMRVSNSI